MRVFIAALFALALAAPADAQVHVDIGIHFPSPPQLVVVPEVRAVRYVPTPSANLFFYGSQYWAFAGGGWYTSRGYNGPWVVVAPTVVPRDRPARAGELLPRSPRTLEAVAEAAAAALGQRVGTRVGGEATVEGTG